MDWGNPKKVGIDEFAERKGHKNFVTVVSNIDNGKPLEIIEGREGDKLIEVLSEGCDLYLIKDGIIRFLQGIHTDQVLPKIDSIVLSSIPKPVDSK